MTAHKLLRRFLIYIWASPGSLLGLIFALVAAISGGSARRFEGVLEVYGGLVSRLLKMGTPWVHSIEALTLGHVVLAQDSHSLEMSRAHERIHVKQYERWGPLFIPLYLLAGLVAGLRGKDPYRDNPFEKEAHKSAD